MTDHETNVPDSTVGADTPPVKPDPPARPQQQEVIAHEEQIGTSGGHCIIIEQRRLI